MFKAKKPTSIVVDGIKSDINAMKLVGLILAKVYNTPNIESLMDSIESSLTDEEREELIIFNLALAEVGVEMSDKGMDVTGLGLPLATQLLKFTTGVNFDKVESWAKWEKENHPHVVDEAKSVLKFLKGDILNPKDMERVLEAWSLSHDFAEKS